MLVPFLVFIFFKFLPFFSCSFLQLFIFSIFSSVEELVELSWNQLGVGYAGIRPKQIFYIKKSTVVFVVVVSVCIAKYLREKLLYCNFGGSSSSSSCMCVCVCAEGKYLIWNNIDFLTKLPNYNKVT